VDLKSVEDTLTSKLDEIELRTATKYQKIIFTGFQNGEDFLNGRNLVFNTTPE
jgi:hypothetical protein